jgi:hypothetical protein
MKILNYQLDLLLNLCFNNYMNSRVKKVIKFHQISEINKFKEPLKTIKEIQFQVFLLFMLLCFY